MLIEHSLILHYASRLLIHKQTKRDPKFISKAHGLLYVDSCTCHLDRKDEEVNQVHIMIENTLGLIAHKLVHTIHYEDLVISEWRPIHSNMSFLMPCTKRSNWDPCLNHSSNCIATTMTNVEPSWTWRTFRKTMHNTTRDARGTNISFHARIIHRWLYSNKSKMIYKFCHNSYQIYLCEWRAFSQTTKTLLSHLLHWTLVTFHIRTTTLYFHINQPALSKYLC